MNLLCHSFCVTAIPISCVVRFSILVIVVLCIALQQDAEAQRQIQQMVNFITNEARDKAQEIEAKALEDFNIEKLKLVQQMKNKVRQQYQQKAKQMETQRAM